MTTLLKQIKQRRLALKLKQHDMLMRVGISRQQYQRLEAKGNPRLDTLVLLAAGLRGHIMLIPDEKRRAVELLLQEDNSTLPITDSVADNPWQGLLGEPDE